MGNVRMRQKLLCIKCISNGLYIVRMCVCMYLRVHVSALVNVCVCVITYCVYCIDSIDDSATVREAFPIQARTYLLVKGHDTCSVLSVGGSVMRR